MPTTRRALAVLGLLAVALVATGCSRARGETAADKRAYVRQMRSDLLAEFYRAEPSLRRKVQSSAGYGAFSNSGMKAFVVGSGHGYGVVRDNRTGHDTYMRMMQFGGGVGFGIKNFLVLFVFTERQALRDFIEHGWQLGGEAEASAIADDVGLSAGTQVKGSAGGAAGGGTGAGGTGESSGVIGRSVGAGIEIYRLTKMGAAVEATVTGTKYWRDSALNE